MENYTIYSEGIWERIIEKYPTIKELTTKLGIKDNPQKAKEIRKNLNSSSLSNDERKLAIELSATEFIEVGFLKQLVSTGKSHFRNGANGYAMAAFDLVLADFKDSFKDWLKEIRKRNVSEDASFAEMYEVFLDVIKLKMEFKVPYTKLFIHTLLEGSAMPREDSLEIKQYFLSQNPEMLSEIKEELIE